MAFAPRPLHEMKVMARDESGVGIRLGYYVTTEDTGSRESLGGFWLDKDEPISFTLPTEPSSTGLAKEETFIVMEGEVTVTSGDQKFEAKPKDVIYFPPGGTYKLVGASEQTSFILFFVSPSVR